MLTITDSLLHDWALPGMGMDVTKINRGNALLVGGSMGRIGSVILAANAILRAGAGSLTIATVGGATLHVATLIPEARVVSLKEGGDGQIALEALQGFINAKNISSEYQAFFLGCGMKFSPDISYFFSALLRSFYPAQVVLDVAAIDVLEEQRRLLPTSGIERRGNLQPSVLLIAPSSELVRASTAQNEPLPQLSDELPQKLARQWNALVSAVGERSLIASPNGKFWQYCGGSAGLAMSGANEVLAGIVTGLVARGASLEQACVWGTALHARAGERLTMKQGPLGFLARDLAGEIPYLMHSLAKEPSHS